MSLKHYQVITIQGESKGFKPTVKGKHQIASEYLRENHGTLSLPSDPTPSSLPLQGGRVSSQPSLELSSSRSVCQSRKWKENEGRRKNGKNGALCLFIAENSPITVYTNGLYSHQDKRKCQKQQKHLTFTRTKLEETKKMQQKWSRRQTAGEVNSG